MSSYPAPPTTRNREGWGSGTTVLPGLLTFGALTLLLVWVLTEGSDRFGTGLAFGGPLVLLAAVVLFANPRVELSLALFLVYLGLVDGYIKLATGSDVATFGRDVILYAIAIGVLIRAFVRDDHLPVPKYTPHILLFVAIVLIQPLHPDSISTRVDMAGFRQHLEFVPLAFLGYLFLRGERRLRLLCMLLLAVAAVNGVVSFWQSGMTPQELARWGPGYEERVLGKGSFEESPRVFSDETGEQRVRPFGLGGDFGFGGAVGLLALPAGIALLGSVRGVARVLVLVGMAAAIAGVLTSQSRLIVVSSVVAVFLYALLSATTAERRRALAAMAVSVGVAYLVIGALDASGSYNVFERYESIRPGSLFETTQRDRGGSLAFIPQYLEEFPFGHGIGRSGPASSEASAAGAQGVNAENEFNLLITEVGIPGLLVLMTLWLRVLFDGVRAARSAAEPERPYLAALVAAFAAATTTWFVATATVSSPMGPFFWTLAGIIAAAATVQRGEPRPR